MAIYKKGSDLGPLVQAAAQQKSERAAVRKQPGGEEVIRQAGLKPISNAMVKPDGTAYGYDYSKKDVPIVPVENQPVSGGVVANRAEYLKSHGKEVPVPVEKRGEIKAGPALGSGVIKKGVLQEKSAPKKKAPAKKAPAKKAPAKKKAK